MIPPPPPPLPPNHPEPSFASARACTIDWWNNCRFHSLLRKLRNIASESCSRLVDEGTHALASLMAYTITLEIYNYPITSIRYARLRGKRTSNHGQKTEFRNVSEALKRDIYRPSRHYDIGDGSWSKPVNDSLALRSRKQL